MCMQTCKFCAGVKYMSSLPYLLLNDNALLWSFHWSCIECRDIFYVKKVWPKCIIRPEEHNNFGACIRVKLVRNLLTGSCLIHSEVVWTSFCGRHCYTVVCHVDEGNYTKTLFTCFLLQIHFALKLKKGWKIVSTRRIDQLVPETVQKFFSGS